MLSLNGALTESMVDVMRVRNSGNMTFPLNIASKPTETLALFVLLLPLCTYSLFKFTSSTHAKHGYCMS